MHRTNNTFSSTQRSVIVDEKEKLIIIKGIDGSHMSPNTKTTHHPEHFTAAVLLQHFIDSFAINNQGVHSRA